MKTAVISRETAAAIWEAHREIDTAAELLATLEAKKNEPFQEIDRNAPTLKDAFGRRQHFQMGIPSGENAHRIFRVEPKLAESIIRAHIAEKQKELVEASERARLELNSTGAEA